MGVLYFLCTCLGPGLACRVHHDIPSTLQSAYLMVGAQEILVSTVNECIDLEPGLCGIWPHCPLEVL